MANKKLAPLSPKAKEILSTLKEKGSMTLQELKETGIEDINPSHLTALGNRGLVSAEKVEKEVQVVTKRKVNVYTFLAEDTE